MKFIGYFDINGMSVHQAIAHLTEAQQANYRTQICAMLEQNHFEVNRFDLELQLIADDILTPVGMAPRLRLQYTAELTALPAPQPSGLILPGQENGQLTQVMLRPLPEDTAQ